MIKRWLRNLIRAEIEELQLPEMLSEIVVQNNQKIENDLVELGILERDRNGALSLPRSQ
jgi:hypothetical protein